MKRTIYASSNYPKDAQEPTCGKCGLVMTPQNAKIHPELFLHDACLSEDMKPAVPDQHPTDDPLSPERIEAARGLIHRSMQMVLMPASVDEAMQTLDALAALAAGGLKDEQIGEALEAARKERAWTIARMAEELDITQNDVNDIECSTDSVAIGELRRAAEALNHRLIVHLVPAAKQEGA